MALNLLLSKLLTIQIFLLPIRGGLLIFINDIPSLRDPESFELIFDDRIEKVQLINGNAVQDYGHVDNGDYFVVTAIFAIANYLRLQNVWINRQKVSFTDEAGVIWSDLRLVFRKIKYLKKFPKYIELTFELWKV